MNNTTHKFTTHDGWLNCEIEVTADKTNRVMDLLLEFIRMGCTEAESLHQDDEYLLQAPITLGQMVDILDVKTSCDE